MACLIAWNDSNIFRAAEESIDEAVVSDSLKSTLFTARRPKRLVVVEVA